MIRLLNAHQSALILIDVQREFLSALPDASALLSDLADLVRLFRRLEAPIVTTVERPVEQKGGLPETLGQELAGYARHFAFEKEYFNLAAHVEIARAVKGLERRQLVLCGAETDVCVLQSALSLLETGYDVFLVDDLIFSSTADCSVAKERLRQAGAQFLTWKTLFHEMVRAVESSPLRL